MRVIAHRAGNDLALLAGPAGDGLDVVEADVHLRRGRLEVRHTKRIWFLPILWDRWYLVNPFAPALLLHELLDALDPRATLMVDMKGPTPGLGRAVLRAVEAHGTTRPLVVSARVWRHLTPFRGRPGTIVLHSAGSPRQLRRLLRRHGPGALSGVSVRRDLLDPATVAALRERAEHVWSWPVNTPEVARELAGWGVTGFISDAPVELAAALSAPASPPADVP